MIVLPGGFFFFFFFFFIYKKKKMFRYPLHTRHPVPLEALRAEISRRRANGAQRIGLIGFSRGGHLASLAALAWHMQDQYRPPDALRRPDTSRRQIRPPP